MRRSQVYREVFEIFGLVPSSEMLELLMKIRPSVAELGRIIVRSAVDDEPTT